MNMNVIVTGSQGFIGSFICDELLKAGYNVIGIDNFSKYGKVERPHDKHPNFFLFEADCSTFDMDKALGGTQIDFIIANAALIGGIGYFHKYAYDLIAKNEAINTNTVNYAIKRHQKGRFGKLVMMSSSMVYENAPEGRVTEDMVSKIPPPSSTYGFQKLACEYFCKGAFEQYGLPYSIVRPFNCVGVGEDLGVATPSKEHFNMALSHVLPDLVFKCLSLNPDEPVPILGDGTQVRHYTHGRDIARGVRMVMESNSVNEAYNISHDTPYTMLELLAKVYSLVHNTSNIPLVNLRPAYRDRKSVV